MADSVDRVFGHALNTVNKIRPGSQRPPSSDRLALYGLYKQSMEGDVAEIADRPTAASPQKLTVDQLKKEQEKWDAWKSKEGLSRTEAKRRYIERLIETMHNYASNTPEARELVEELEFVWDQIKSNSQHSNSEHSSPLQHVEHSGYIQADRSGNGVSSTLAATDREQIRTGNEINLKVLSPVSQNDEDAMIDEEPEEFVDAPLSQIDRVESQASSEKATGGAIQYRNNVIREADRILEAAGNSRQWRKRVESSLMRLTTEVAALREQLESRRHYKQNQGRTLLGWILKLSWWAIQLVVADAVLLWIVILYLRRKQDRRLEGAVRVLLGDAVAQVQKVRKEVKLPRMPQIAGRKTPP